MKRWTAEDFSGVTFGRDVTVMADEADIKAGARLGDGVRITASRVEIGHSAAVEHETEVKGLGRDMELFRLGDHAFVGFRNQVFCPSFSMGDYSQLHNSGLNTGYAPLSIGHNCWIGQNSILNCTEALSLGNNVRVGTQSQLWTHVASGELLEGCTLYNSRALVLEDDVWIVGGAVVSPGIVVKKRSIVMTGAVLTKSTEFARTYAGIPAKDVTDKMSFWETITPSEKFERMREFVDEFIALNTDREDKVLVEPSVEELSSQSEDAIAIFREFDWNNCSVPARVAVFDLKSKSYTKKLMPIEVDFIKFNLGFRARFIPR